MPAAEAHWLTPTEPTKMVALWNNFRAASEKNGWAIPPEPLIFIKTPNSFNAHDRPIAVAAVRRYVLAVKEDEWTLHRNQKASGKAEAALHDLQSITVRMARDTPGPATAQAFALVDDIATTRSDRLWIGQNHTAFNYWLAVLPVGLMTHLAVASVHLDRPRTGALALALLTATTTIAYWSLGVVDDPYRHLDKLDPMSWLG